MFLDDFVPIERSLVVANGWLISHRAELAEEAADLARRDGSEIVLGAPRTRPDSVVFPFRWLASGTSPFHLLEGDLATGALGSDVTHLRLSATCDLAVPRPGRRSEQQETERRTERDVRRFLVELAAVVERRTSPSLH
jgi:hypothetical protein